MSYVYEAACQVYPSRRVLIQKADSIEDPSVDERPKTIPLRWSNRPIGSERILCRSHCRQRHLAPSSMSFLSPSVPLYSSRESSPTSSRSLTPHIPNSPPHPSPTTPSPLPSFPPPPRMMASHCSPVPQHSDRRLLPFELRSRLIVGVTYCGRSPTGVGPLGPAGSLRNLCSVSPQPALAPTCLVIVVH